MDIIQRCCSSGYSSAFLLPVVFFLVFLPGVLDRSPSDPCLGASRKYYRYMHGASALAQLDRDYRAVGERILVSLQRSENRP
jgi:hypothetical protein